MEGHKSNLRPNEGHGRSEGQGHCFTDDSQSSQGMDGRSQKKSKNTSTKSSKKSSKASKQASKIMQTSQQTGVGAVSTSASQSSGASTTTSYTTARWSHKSYGCQVTPTGSLLEEVLNEKKMALLKSPEVMEFLQHLQSDVRQKKQLDFEPRGERHSSTSNVLMPAPEKTSSKRSQKRKRSSSARGHSDKFLAESPSLGKTSDTRTSVLSSSFDMTNDQDMPTDLSCGQKQGATGLYKTINPSGRGKDDARAKAPDPGTSQADIWSKEASAFSTVASTFTPSNL